MEPKVEGAVEPCHFCEGMGCRYCEGTGDHAEYLATADKPEGAADLEKLADETWAMLEPCFNPLASRNTILASLTRAADEAEDAAHQEVVLLTAQLAAKEKALRLYEASDKLVLKKGEEMVRDFAEKILHGDNMHREWLTEAAECYCHGEPLPEPRDDGSKARLTAQLAAITNFLDDAGVATGSDGSHNYTLLERIENLAKTKDYFFRQTDDARAQLAAAKELLWRLLRWLTPLQRCSCPELVTEAGAFLKDNGGKEGK